MNDKWGTPETQPPQPPEPRLCSVHAFLALAVISETVSILGLIVEDQTSIVIFRGAYSVLAGLFVAGMIGWIVGVAERRVRRQVAAERAELLDRIDKLTGAVEELQRQVTSTRVTYLPQQRAAGHRYASQAVVGGSDNDTVAFSRTGLDAQTIADARSVARRLMDGDESAG